MSFASRIRRAVLGPTDEEISQISQAAGGPPYPIPPLSSVLPSGTLSLDEWMPDTATDLPAVREEAMTQPKAEELLPRYEYEEPAHADPSDTAPIDFRSADVPRRPCEHCRGTGYVLTIRDRLDDIVAMLPVEAEDKDAMIAEFYRRLLDNYPHLAFLFPTDLTTGDALNSKGHRQRDQLWNGLEALLTRYDPDRRDSKNMRALVTALEAFGRDHSAFRREDGSVEGATEDEYIAVRNVLLRLCQDAFQEMWEPAHTYALMRAYRFAMVKMMNAAEDHPMTAFAREPRR